jgi:RNA polymerase sigma factor (sigma-70 family)
MAILRPRAIKSTTNHEAIFIERYRRLLAFALQLADGDRERAEDIVHDAFIQFTLSHPDLQAIENLEAYLCGMLRKLYLSQMRRDSRRRIQPHFLVEYDSAETGLDMIDPHNRLQAQEELRRVCHYACSRKETSKAGSVLILRFFHGYYPSEITKLVRASRHAVDLRLRSARAEAKAILTDPEALVFMSEKPATDFRKRVLAQSIVEFLAELRHTIFRSRQGSCLSREQLDSLYGPFSEAQISCEILAHVVSCQRCLDQVNKMLGLPSLSDRFAVDTMGKDDSSPGGGSSGTGSGAEDKAVTKCLRRAREVFEHRPQELHISVNGFIQGSQTINSEQSEQTLDIDMAEQIAFVEVFTEQETRLLFLDVEPPPSGPVEQRARVDLSNERTLELTLGFRGPWPTLHTIYHDPLLKAAREPESDLEQESSVTEPPSTHAERNQLKGSSRNIVTRAVAKLRGLRKGQFWLRPTIVTTIVAAILVISLSVYLQLRSPAVTASDLLKRSTKADEAIASRPETVLHRTLQLEERSSSGDLITRSRVEIWQSADRGIMARRLYNEKNKLTQGDWRRSDGVQTLYQHGTRPQLQLTPEKRGGNITISFEEVWQQSVSATDFTSLIGNADSLIVEEGRDAYEIRYTPPAGRENARGLVRAALVMRRNDLHPVEETLTVSDGKEQREFRLAEISFERRASSTVESSVFEPEAELVGPAVDRVKISPHSFKNERSALLPRRHPVATTELEVDVLNLLHRAKADMGEQVSVTRDSDGTLRIEGIFDSDQRKDEILRELRPVTNNPAVKFELQTVSEALKRQSQPGQPAGPVTVQPAESTANTVPVDAELHRYFSGKVSNDALIHEEMRRFSNLMLEQSREAMAHAWALKRLADRFSSEQLTTLDKDAANKWLSMIGEHAQGLSQETATLRQELQPIFPNQNTGGAAEELELRDYTDLSRAIQRLFDLCSQYTQTVRSAFIISSEDTNAQVIRTGQFWRSLKRAESLSARIKTATQLLKNN